MSSSQEKPDPTMAEIAMETFDLQGEHAMILMLGQVAQESQSHQAWQGAGVCVLADQSAVIQEHSNYKFRWMNADGKPDMSWRPTHLSEEERRFIWFPRGPIHSWPTGKNVWFDVDEILTEKAYQKAVAAAQNMGHDQPEVAQLERSEISVVELLNACPELEQTMQDAMKLECPLPEWITGTLDEHIRECAYLAVEKLPEPQLQAAVDLITNKLYPTA